MAEPTPDEQIQQMKKDLEVLKTRSTLDTERKTRDALAKKAVQDALKDQATSQSTLTTAQAQQAFAELQGIKAGIAGSPALLTGKEGTVKVSAGVAGTALLRSKRPMLQLLDDVAAELIELWPDDVVLVTEEQLAQAYAALFALKRIGNQATRLIGAAMTARTALGRMAEELAPNVEAARDLGPGPAGALPFAFPSAIAGAYALGFTLDTINSLAKLLRTNRQLDVFGADAEATQILGYLLESKTWTFSANPAMLGDQAMVVAESLMETLDDLGGKVREGNDVLKQIKTRSDAITKDHANDLALIARIPTEADLGLLKAEIEAATILLDSLHPTRKPDVFWAQVGGQVIARKIQDKFRLLLDAKAQTVQVTESRWYRSDRILATGEVQVAYRFLKPDGSTARAGVILKVSGTENAQIDQLVAFEWPRKNSSEKSHQREATPSRIEPPPLR